MIRTLRLTDILRQALLRDLKGPDLVQTRDTVVPGPQRVPYTELLRHLLVPRASRQCWVLEERRRLQVLLSARRRSGPRAWELEHLSTAPGGWDRADEVLEQCTSYSGQRGAERIFLRLLQGSPLEAVARRAGFFPCVAETVYEGPGSALAQRTPLPGGLRCRTLEDQQPLFRLYNASVPAQVRSAHGLTLEQWHDAAEEVRGRRAEFVHDREGALRAWLRVSFRGRAAVAEMMIHPEEGALAPDLVELGTRLAGPRRRVFWLVSAYQVALQQALAQATFAQGADYAVLVKSVAVRVKESSLIPART